MAQIGTLCLTVRIGKDMEAALLSYLDRCERNGFTPTEEDVIEVMKPFIHIGKEPLGEINSRGEGKSGCGQGDGATVHGEDGERP